MKVYFISAFMLAFAVSTSAFAMGSAPVQPPVTAVILPSGVQEIHVTAKQFEFSPNLIQVKKGIPVRIVLTSMDVTHGFALDAFNVNATITREAPTTVEFTPDRTGTFDFHCSVFCGLGHAGMSGKVIVTD